MPVRLDRAALLVGIFSYVRNKPMTKTLFLQVTRADTRSGGLVFVETLQTWGFFTCCHMEGKSLLLLKFAVVPLPRRLH